MENEKKNNLKISKTIMAIGIVMLIIGIVCLIASINSFVQAKRAYDVAYDQWHDNWWVHHTADLNDQPDKTYVGKIVFIFLSIVMIMVSIVVTFIGARPYMNKFANKYSNEIKTFNLEDLSNTKNTTETNTNTNRKKECIYCGAKLDKNSTTCNYCGKDN